MEIENSTELRRSMRSRTRTSAYSGSTSSTMQENPGENHSEPDEPETDQESEMEVEQSDDDDYVANGKRKRASSSTKSSRRSKKSKRTPLPSTLEQMDGFEENQLYKALSDPEVSIQTLAIEWIENFLEDEENNGVDSVANLINLLLRSCGCIYLFQPHDLVNLDSAAETVEELVIAFKHQKSHEYPFISNNKDLKFFRTNILEFFTTLTGLAHDKGLLYIKRGSNEQGESLASPLITQVFTWLLVLTSCTIRPLRYISTTVLMAIQTKLCELISDVSGNLEKHQRQLNNSKSSKRKQRARIDTIEDSIMDLNHQKETILEYFTDITETAFIHRYRDVDPLIRLDCISGLGDWIVTYPDYFFSSTYLRYFGWLLSDPAHSVRCEATKCLSRLYRSNFAHNSIMSGDLNQFTERFEPQLIHLAIADNDSNVRYAATLVLEDLVKLEFLDYDKQITLVQNFITSMKLGGEFGKVNTEKVKHEYSKFIHNVNLQHIETLKVDNDDFIDDLKSSTTFDIDKCIQIKSLITVLTAAESKPLISRLSSIVDSEETQVVDNFSVSTIFKTLYPTSIYQGSWEFLLEYFSFDISSIEVDDDNDLLKDFRDSLDLSPSGDKLYLLSFILGALSALSLKKKYEDTDIDNPKTVVSRTVEYLEPLWNESSKSSRGVFVFLKIWCLLISDYNKFVDVYATFQNLDRIDLFNSINRRLLSEYADDSFSVEESIDHYDGLLSLLSNEDTSLVSTSRPNVNDILEQFQNKINHKLTESAGDSVFNALYPVSEYALKVKQIGNYTNIDKFIDGLDKRFLALLSSWEFNGLMVSSALTFLSTSEKVIVAYKAILDLYLIVNASKFETLLGPDVVQRNHNVNVLFHDSKTLLSTILESLKRLDHLVNVSNEKIGSSLISVSIADARSSIEKLDELRTLFIVKFIDLIVSFKLFYEKFKSGNEFIGFSEFYASPELEKTVKYSLPSAIQNKLLNMFLIKESKLANRLKVNLDRNDDEDVNYDDMVDDDKEMEFTNSFQDSDDEVDSDIDEEGSRQRQEINSLKAKNAKEKSIWKAEKDLCVYFVKIFTLVNLGMVDTFIEKRIQLNAKKIGGLFEKIVDQNKPEQTPSIPEAPQNPVGQEPPEQAEDSSQVTSNELELNINESSV